MHKPVKYVEKGVTYAAGAAWAVFERVNRIRPNPSFTPKWSDKPLLKSYQKTKPPLGWPRTTDSLCPRCVPEIRQQIIDGKLPKEILLNEKMGEIKAQIIERDGKILMVKDCPKHGHFEDVMAIDTAFFRHLEEVFPGRDIRAHNDEKLHNHGSSTIKHGRGSVLVPLPKLLDAPSVENVRRNLKKFVPRIFTLECVRFRDTAVSVNGTVCSLTVSRDFSEWRC